MRICKPFDLDKNLGRAYNLAMKGLTSGDWMCVMDADCSFYWTPQVRIIYDYIAKFPKAGIFVCRANRIHPLAKNQLLLEEPSEDFNWYNHYKISRTLAEKPSTVKQINKEISGFLMVFSYDTWKEVGGFSENLKCLGVDNDFAWKVLETKTILRMDRLYVWHGYRAEGLTNKEHLL